MTIPHTIQDPLKPIVGMVHSVGHFWLARSPFSQIMLVLLVLLAKNGFDIELRNVQEAYLPASIEFPEPRGYFSASFGQVGITSVLGISTTTNWVVLHLVATIATLTIACWMAIRTTRAERSLSLLIVAAATASSTLLIGIGKYDVLTVLGAFILILSKRTPGAAFGALIMASGNPEQAMLGALGLLILSMTRNFKDFRTRATLALLISVTSWLLVQWWFLTNNMDSGRLSLVRAFLAESLGRFTSSPELAILSWYGAGWIIVLASLALIGRGSRWPLLVSLILIPGVASLITADGARVFAPIALPSFLAVGLWLASTKISPSSYRTEAVGSFIILLLIVPTALTGPGWLFGQVLGQFAKFLSL